MIKKVIVKRRLRDKSSPAEDRKYWLSRPPEERLSAVEFLRKQHYGNSARLQRTARVIQRA